MPMHCPLLPKHSDLSTHKHQKWITQGQPVIWTKMFCQRESGSQFFTIGRDMQYLQQQHLSIVTHLVCDSCRWRSLIGPWLEISHWQIENSQNSSGQSKSRHHALDIKGLSQFRTHCQPLRLARALYLSWAEFSTEPSKKWACHIEQPMDHNREQQMIGRIWSQEDPYKQKCTLPLIMHLQMPLKKHTIQKIQKLSQIFNPPEGQIESFSCSSKKAR